VDSRTNLIFIPHRFERYRSSPEGILECRAKCLAVRREITRPFSERRFLKIYLAGVEQGEDRERTDENWIDNPSEPSTAGVSDEAEPSAFGQPGEIEVSVIRIPK
jgi:hypothetical protein